MAYLSAADPVLSTRTWKDANRDFIPPVHRGLSSPDRIE